MMKLNIDEFILDEIVSIELVGESDTIDICVEDTHMFFANDIYTHNSSTSATVVDVSMIGGNIKKAQVAHLVISIAKTLAQRDTKTATIAILKSRFGGDGKVFQDCTFDNSRMLIDTTTMQTFDAFDQDQRTRQALRVRQVATDYRERNVQQQRN